MKYVITNIIICLFLINTGCVVQSFHPFAPEHELIGVPESILGDWRVNKYLEKQVNTKSSKNKIENWTFNETNLILKDKNNIKASLNIDFFKIKEDYFIITSPEAPIRKKRNQLYFFHLAPVFTCSLIKIKNDEMSIFPMNYDKIKEYNNSNNLKHVKINKSEDHIVFNESPESWFKIISKLKDKGLFHGEVIFQLTKIITKR